MILSGLDLGLIICLSYLSGIGTGLIICCKYKDIFLVRSRSRDNLCHTHIPSQLATPVVPSAPPPTNPTVTKITLE